MFMFPSVAIAADGVFRGKVVDPPVTEPEHRGWIFVQGRNKLVRRVEVEHAIVTLPSSVRSRRPCNSECIMPGQEVRVTARQDSAGEWRAKKVEILKLSPLTLPFASNHGISLDCQKSASISSFMKLNWILSLTEELLALILLLLLVGVTVAWYVSFVIDHSELLN